MKYSTKTGGTAEIKPHSSGKGYAVHYEGKETAGHYRDIREATKDAKKFVGLKKAEENDVWKAEKDAIDQFMKSEGKSDDSKLRSAGFSQHGHKWEKSSVNGERHHNHYIHQDWNTKEWHLRVRTPKAHGVGTDYKDSKHKSAEEAIAHSASHQKK